MSRPGFGRAVQLGAVSLVVGLATGCGDPLVGEAYRGEPLLTLTGRVLYGERAPQETEDLRVTVEWPSAEAVFFEHPLELSTDFPAYYELSLFTPPPLAVGRERLQVGILVLYDDKNDNLSFEQGEDTVVGASMDVGVLYVPTPEETAAWEAENADVRPPEGVPPIDDDDPRLRLPYGLHAVGGDWAGCGRGPEAEVVEPAVVDLELWSTPQGDPLNCGDGPPHDRP